MHDPHDRFTPAELAEHELGPIMDTTRDHEAPAPKLTPEQEEDMRVYGTTITTAEGERVDPSDPRIAKYMATHKRVRDEIAMFRPSEVEQAAQREHVQAIGSGRKVGKAAAMLFASSFGGFGADPRVLLNGFAPGFPVSNVRKGYGKASPEKKAKRKAARKARRGNR
jgi:hypothetical protein